MDIKIGKPVLIKEHGHQTKGFTTTLEAFPVTGLGAIIQTTTILSNPDGSQLLSTSSVFIPSPPPEKKEGATTA